MEFKIKIHRSLLLFLFLLPMLVQAQDGSARVRMLVDALEHDPDFKVRIAASQALAKIADGTVADWMIRAFRHDDDEAVRLSILYAISEIPDERIILPLIEVANQEVLTGKERQLIEQIIWNFRDAFNISAWINEAINSSDIEIKKTSIWILGIIGESNLTPVFQKLLESSNEDIQLKTFESLSRIGNAQAFEICKSQQKESYTPQVARAAKFCEQMNLFFIQKKILPENTFRKKLVTPMEEVRKKSIRPENYLGYLNKNLNQREVDQALLFLSPQANPLESEKSVKLIEKEKVSTFELKVDLISKYEFSGNDLEILKTIIRDSSNSLDHCYLAELPNNPKLGGDIKTYFKILRSGKTAEVKITDSSMKNKTVESCMLGELEQFEFPQLPIDSVNLIYTFTFIPPMKARVEFNR